MRVGPKIHGNDRAALLLREIDGHIPDKEDGKGYMIGKRDNFSFPNVSKK